MNKKQLLSCIVLFAVIFALMMPSFTERVYFENANKAVVLSIDYTGIKTRFENEKIPGLLSDAKKLGINTLTLNIEDLKTFQNSANSGDFDLALFVDAHGMESGAENLIEELTTCKNLKYINISGNFKNELHKEKVFQSLGKIIKEKKLMLVVSETKDQLANDISQKEYNHIINSADGAILRCYNTSYSANDIINPELRFHQMLNSLKDRNTHFINLVPFEDKSATDEDNYYAMLSSVSLFIDEVSDDGYLPGDFKISYKGYDPQSELNLALGFILSILLCYIMLKILFGNIAAIIKIILSISALCGFVFPFVMSYVAEVCYPLFLAVASSCFIISIVFYTVKKYSPKGFAFCLVSVFAVCFIGVILRGYSLSVVLSGADYYLYFKTFRGVKLSLVVPVLYAVFAYAKLFGFAKPQIKKFINGRNILLISFGFILLSALAYIYIVRSGNSTALSFETKIRNSLDVLMGIRPRTKEFLIGWPCLWLFVWYRTNTKQNLIPFVLSLGVAILSSSVINSFCHVFTPVLSIYRRTLNGFILSVPIAALVVFINLLVFKLLKIKKNNLR